MSVLNRNYMTLFSHDHDVYTQERKHFASKELVILTSRNLYETSPTNSNMYQVHEQHQHTTFNLFPGKHQYHLTMARGTIFAYRGKAVQDHGNSTKMAR